MAPILGIMASQISGHLWAPSGAYDSIATTTVGAGGVSSVTFSSIPSTYKHLEIRAIARGTASVTDQEQYITFNGSASNYYAGHILYGEGSSALSTVAPYSTVVIMPRLIAASSTASAFSGYVTSILDYADTSKNKTVRSLGGFDANGTGNLGLISGLWMNTSAVTSINIRPSSGNFAEYSSFALYGIKGN